MKILENIDLCAEFRVLDDQCKTKELKFRINVANQQIILRGNTILLIDQFITASKPNYAALPYKPNRCIFYSFYEKIILHQKILSCILR